MLLITCAVIRAVHLELVDSLSAQITLAALRRYVARRGLPSVIMSDNARGFVAAKDLVLKYYGSEGPNWRFIVPRAPWWGGFWERLVKSVKSALKRSLGNRSLTRVELETTLLEIEASVNSRPLTFVGDEVDFTAPLTPAHFLVGRLLTGGAVKVSMDDPLVNWTDLVTMLEHRNDLLEQFWGMWTSDYIRNLPPCNNAVSGKGEFTVGNVVMIREDECPRLQWPLGVVQKVFTGRDGLVRSAEVKTTRGVFVRPIQRLHDLEINDGFESSDHVVSRTLEDLADVRAGATPDLHVDLDTDHFSRYGRKIKPPDKLNL